jgi:hypothetical protein
MNLVSDFFTYCVANRFFVDSAIFTLLLTGFVACVASFVLYGLMRALDTRISYKRAFRLCLSAGIAALVATLAMIILDSCFFPAADVMPLVIGSATLLTGTVLLSKRTPLSVPKAALIALSTLGISYAIIAVLLFYSAAFI